MIDIPLRPIVAALIATWCVAVIFATYIEKGIGHTYGKEWNDLLAGLNVLFIERSKIKYNISWFLILIARFALICLLSIAGYYIIIHSID
jgi:hypothetical protein